MTIKAVGLLSGGLDSTLAAKLLIEQGIEVIAINFKSPFCTCTPKTAGCSSVLTAIKNLGNIALHQVALGNEYLAMVKKPRFGYGRGINPCIDCRIMKVRKAAEYMREINASFLFTGEVLGQRPKSQHFESLRLIEKESGIEGLILRPLSAAALPETIPEQKGWVDRNKFLAITGKSRKPQIALALEKGIHDYPCPAGGCLLTDEHISLRLRDYFSHTAQPEVKDIPLLKIGRHFRLPHGEKIIIARNSDEGDRMLTLCKQNHHIIYPHNFSAPAVLTDRADLTHAFSYLFFYTKKQVPDDAVIVWFHDGQKTHLDKSQWPVFTTARDTMVGQM